jgi:hypothetical protein
MEEMIGEWWWWWKGYGDGKGKRKEERKSTRDIWRPTVL